MARSKYVLVVEDDDDARAILSKILTSLGVTVMAAADGEEAVEIAEREPPAVIMLDLMLPRMNGFEFLYWLRGHEQLKKVPVIIVSGYVGDVALPELAGVEVYAKGEIRASHIRKRMSLLLGSPDSDEVSFNPLDSIVPDPASTAPESRREALRHAVLDLLSDRELEILRLILEGLSNRQIAEQLVLSLNTVKTHVKSIFDKLNISSRTEAIIHIRDLGLFG